MTPTMSLYLLHIFLILQKKVMRLYLKLYINLKISTRDIEKLIQFWMTVSYFSSERLNLLCREYDDLISKGEILPHSSEGRSLLKTAE